MDKLTMHDTCVCPPPDACLAFPPGVQCAPIRCEDRAELNLPQKPDFVVDPNQSIVVNWPPQECQVGQGDSSFPDTGIREDLLAKIPDQIVPQVVTVHGTPAPRPGEQESQIQHQKLQHPLCPDGQFHMRITPKDPIKPEIRIPDLGCAVRQPLRKWRQCIENSLVNDAVRRPMARWCHKRPLPPLVIPKTELARLQERCTETERKAKEKQERIEHRECQRKQSRQRMAKWNYTVEKLLDRKRAEDERKEQEERESFAQLMKDIKSSKDAFSEEQIARANKLSLYRKGLIKDLHSAMAFSKMMQDIERSRQKSEKDQGEGPNLPVCETKCMKRMLHEITRPDFTEKTDKPKKINEKLLKVLQNIETRQKEQVSEVQDEVCKVKQLLQDNLPDLPQAYLKHIAEPKCDEVASGTDEKFRRRREAFNDELDDKLAVDAYIEAHEKEVERQACEYAKYKQHKDLIRKELEARLIREKVQYNMEKSERAAAVLVEMQNRVKEAANDYDGLKQKWEEEYEKKDDEKIARQKRIMEKVHQDFIERKGVERCKWQMRDVSRCWARERLVAVENYEQECDRRNLRRQEAEEIQLFNQALASEKKCQAEREKLLDNAWAAKIKGQYFQEMQEMKDYASSCIRDWTGKGRSPLPMHMAMKKWEYDSSMHPRMFRQYEEQKKKEAGDETPDTGGFALLVGTSSQPACRTLQATETTQTTSQRLGFC